MIFIYGTESLWYNLSMFTGIVEELGKIRQITSNKIEIECKNILNDTKNGDSICVNGVCLTVTNISNEKFTADISPETLKVSSLGELKIGDYVNLERAMSANGRFGGHIVSGHIDGCGKIKRIERENNFYTLEVELPFELSRYVIKKGSIAINGISLTVSNTYGNTICAAVIPHTYLNTNLQYLHAEGFVNIEVDMFAKYIEKFLSTRDNKSRIDENFLIENGFC